MSKREYLEKKLKTLKPGSKEYEFIKEMIAELPPKLHIAEDSICESCE